MKQAIFFTVVVGMLVGVALVVFPIGGSVMGSKNGESGSSARTIYVKNASGHWPENPYDLVFVPGPGTSGGSWVPRQTPQDGSIAHPYTTVSQGYAAAMPGDTLVIAAGYYPESVNFNKPINIRSECGTVTIGAQSDSGPRDFVLAEDAVPLMNTGGMFDEWNDATTNQFGVIGEDPFGNTIYSYAARNPQLFQGAPHTFYPMQGDKRTLCGTLSSFGFHDGWDSKDEADWNLNIIPFAPRYSSLFDAAIGRPGANMEEWTTCKSGDSSIISCVEAEITPDESLYGFDWFNANTQQSPLVGKCLCVYGPWITDNKHGAKPEIHPSELLWWKAPASSVCGGASSTLDGTFLLMVQDDSNRFDHYYSYGTGGTPDFCWRPWSAFPRTGKFKLAFRLNTLAANPQNLDVSIDKNRNVNVNPHDATDGGEHMLVYKDRPLLRVRETGDDGYVQVGFENLFRRIEPEGEVLYGYVTLSSSVGKNDRGGEGHILISLNHR